MSQSYSRITAFEMVVTGLLSLRKTRIVFCLAIVLAFHFSTTPARAQFGLGLFGWGSCCDTACDCDVCTGKDEFPYDDKSDPLGDDGVKPLDGLGDDGDDGLDEAFTDIADPGGAAASPLAGIPGTLGDLGGGTLSVGSTFLMNTGVNLGIAGGDRRYKFVENSSPIPQDRVFFNYNHFHSSLVAGNGSVENLDRYVFGMERSMHCGMTSFELRIPFAGGLDSHQVFNHARGGTEFGDISLTFKRVIYEDCCSLLSGGLAIQFPTSGSARFTGPPGTGTLTVDNNAYHLQPFLAYVATPSCNCFYQLVTQFDFDTNGYRFQNNMTMMGGKVHDPTLWYISGSTGYWLTPSLAGLVELHYTTTLQNPDVDATANVQFREGRFDLLNLTAGFHLSLGCTSSLRVFTSVPLRGDTYLVSGINPATNDRFYDSEIGVQLNYGF